MKYLCFLIGPIYYFICGVFKILFCRINASETNTTRNHYFQQMLTSLKVKGRIRSFALSAGDFFFFSSPDCIYVYFFSECSAQKTIAQLLKMIYGTIKAVLSFYT